MADNYTVTQGSGTTMASDDVGGVHYPIVKIAQGVADAATLVSSTNPLSTTDGATQVDDAAFTPATSRVLMVGAEFDNVATDSVDEGDGGALRMSANRALYATLRDAAGNERGANVNASNQLEVSAALAAGTNNIGDVDVLTQPARARTTDTIAAALATDAIMSATTALTPKFAAIAAASSGDNTLVAAVASKKIRVLALMGVVAGAVSLYFTSGAGGTVIFGGSTNKIALAANGGFVLPFNPLGWFENSSTNQALVLNLSSAVVFSGGIVYVEV